MRHLVKIRILALIFSGVLLAGCLGGNPSAPPRFYMLSPMVEYKTLADMGTGDNPVVIGIASVQVPEYLNRPQIVKRLDETELTLGEFDRWAEPLADNIFQVIVENLSNLLNADNVRIFSWRGSSPIDYKLEIQVMRMDGNPGEAVSLVAHWAILDERGNEVIMMKRARISEAVDTKDYKALVAAHNRAIKKLSEDIAAGIRSIVSR